VIAQSGEHRLLACSCRQLAGNPQPCVSLEITVLHLGRLPRRTGQRPVLPRRRVACATL